MNSNLAWFNMMWCIMCLRWGLSKFILLTEPCKRQATGWKCTHMLSWVHRLWVDSLLAAPCGSPSPAGHKPETGQYRGTETYRTSRSPTEVLRMLKDMHRRQKKPEINIKRMQDKQHWVSNYSKVWISGCRKENWPQTSDLMEKVL